MYEIVGKREGGKGWLHMCTVVGWIRRCLLLCLCCVVLFSEIRIYASSKYCAALRCFFCAVFVWLVVCMLPLGLSCHCIGNLNVDYRTDLHLDDKEDSFRLE